MVKYLSSVVCSFFFSSRRRHTRLVSDWSSDVCRLLLEIEEHTSELQSLTNLVCRLLLEKIKQKFVIHGLYVPDCDVRAVNTQVSIECKLMMHAHESCD